ncbi:MAG: fluoride efflux transporter CrcB [Firmicutes bacterium]|nr:fluoride efflux transporter CrcB [Bacillota bacterium]
MVSIFYVGLGGFIGAIGRYAVSQVPLTTKSNFPLATFFVNVVGSLILGVLFNLSIQYHFTSSDAMLLLGTGIMGSFTTFSTFSVESIKLIKIGRTLTVILYILLSLILCPLSVLVGFLLVQLF